MLIEPETDLHALCRAYSCLLLDGSSIRLAPPEEAQEAMEQQCMRIFSRRLRS